MTKQVNVQGLTSVESNYLPKELQIDHIPPTEAALKEHIKQTVYKQGAVRVKPLLYMYISSYRALKNGNGEECRYYHWIPF